MRPLGLKAGFVLATVLAAGLFAYGSSFALRDRLRGDAFQYLRLGTQQKLSQVLSPGERTPGFPVLIWLDWRMREALGASPAWSDPERFVNDLTMKLFIFHLICLLIFILALTQWNSLQEKGRISPAWLLPAVFHPSLVLHETVPLTDGLCADLAFLILGVFTYLRVIRSHRLKGALGCLIGALVAFQVLVRPSYLIPDAMILAGSLLLHPRIDLKNTRSRETLPSLLAILMSVLVLTPFLIACHSVYGSFCLQDPEFLKTNANQSLSDGRDGIRVYWSGFSPEIDKRVIIKDSYLSENWATRCPPLPGHSISGLATCFLRAPQAGFVFIAKKTLALMDAYQLQPYAVDLTPPWYRRLTRIFNGLAFAGLLSCIYLLFEGFFSRTSRDSWVLWIAMGTLSYVGLQDLFHIEGRYGLGALPGAYFGLSSLAARIELAGSLKARLPWVLILWAGILLFGLQTREWDRSDPYLSRIEKIRVQ